MEEPGLIAQADRNAATPECGKQIRKPVSGPYAWKKKLKKHTLKTVNDKEH